MASSGSSSEDQKTTTAPAAAGARGGLFGAGGRFAAGTTDPVMEKFNASIGVDQRLYAQDLDGSIAYAKANVGTGILTHDECQSIVDGLQQVKLEWQQGTFIIQPSDEDIHTANERRLTELIGANIGGKLHTGRSRNDQVATDCRLWTVATERQLLQQLANLLLTGAETAKIHVDLLMAGYTHLQPAQPIRYSHWLCSHLFPLMRDAERLAQLIPRANVSPLGSGALAGNAFNIDRAFLAAELQFATVTPNSLDAVADRDFVVEFLFWASLLHTHLSQFAEDVIVQNMLKTIVISEMYSTGSSLMPQKKNPDALELLRGKAGLALGRLVSLTTTLKGLPRAYNKDLQDDKTLLFDAVDTVQDCLAICTGVMATMVPVKEKLLSALSPEMLATDLADYLVRKGVPFRETHHIAGAAVRIAEENHVPLDQLTLPQLQSIDNRIEADVTSVWNYEMSVERKSCAGGTAKSAVLAQIDTIETFARSLLPS